MKNGDFTPNPSGWKILIKPYKVEEKTAGGIILPDEVKTANQYGAVCAQVIKMGDLVYTGDKFISKSGKGDKSWCNLEDWIMIGKFAGNKFTVEGEEYRLINDDDVLATVPDPSKIERFSL